MTRSTNRRLLALACASLLVLSGCQSPTPALSEKSAALAADAACVVTQASYNHIFARHCTASSGASQLQPQYCTLGGMQTFCQMVQNAPNTHKYRTVQPDGRVRYDSNLGMVVGTNGEKCGRLIIQSPTNGEVVTEFPELAGAPGSCS